MRTDTFTYKPKDGAEPPIIMAKLSFRKLNESRQQEVSQTQDETTVYNNYVDSSMGADDRRKMYLQAAVHNHALPLDSERSLASSMTVLSLKGSTTSRLNRSSVYEKQKNSSKKKVLHAKSPSQVAYLQKARQMNMTPNAALSGKSNYLK